MQFTTRINPLSYVICFSHHTESALPQKVSYRSVIYNSSGEELKRKESLNKSAKFPQGREAYRSDYAKESTGYDVSGNKALLTAELREQVQHVTLLEHVQVMSLPTGYNGAATRRVAQPLERTCYDMESTMCLSQCQCHSLHNTQLSSLDIKTQSLTELSRCMWVKDLGF